MSNLPVVVEQNLDKIRELGAAQIAELINIRAGRTPEAQVTAEAILNQFNLIESELLEGKQAAVNGDLNQVRDAVADIALLALGQQGVIKGLDLDDDYKRMCAFNMTRIPQTIQEANATIEKYNKLGIQAVVYEVNIDRPDLGIVQTLYPVRTIHEDQWDEKGNHYAPNKFLKSAEFIDVNYDDKEDISILVRPEDKAQVGFMFTKEMAAAIKKKIENNHGTHGTIPAKMVSELIESFIGKRF